jgi:hypothetical protein
MPGVSSWSEGRPATWDASSPSFPSNVDPGVSDLLNVPVEFLVIIVAALSGSTAMAKSNSCAWWPPFLTRRRQRHQFCPFGLDEAVGAQGQRCGAGNR